VHSGEQSDGCLAGSETFIEMYVALFNAQRTHQRLQPIVPQLTFDLYVWALAQQ